MTGILGAVLGKNERWVDRDLITFFRWHDRDMLTHHENKLNKVLWRARVETFRKIGKWWNWFFHSFWCQPALEHNSIVIAFASLFVRFSSKFAIAAHLLHTERLRERTLTFWASCRVLKLKTSTQQTGQEGEFNYQFDSWFTSEPPSLLRACSTIIEPIVSIICEHRAKMKRALKKERKTFITTPEKPHKSLMQTLKRSKPKNFRNFLLYLRWLIDTFI